MFANGVVFARVMSALRLLELFESRLFETRNDYRRLIIASGSLVSRLVAAVHHGRLEACSMALLKQLAHMSAYRATL